MAAQRNAAPSAHEGFAPVQAPGCGTRILAGAGIPLVLMHAATAASRLGASDAGIHASRLRVNRIRSRGWGRTVPDPGGRPAPAADDLVALMDYLHVDRVIWSALPPAVSRRSIPRSPSPHASQHRRRNSIGGVQDESFVESDADMRPPEFTAMPPEVREVSPFISGGESGPARSDGWN